ncbi:MAG: hypothetical protein JWM10_1729 [Myxococcaceae bacterium]|nr:hypothetical protein [Myxococcaceae bacterium]
MIGLPLALLYSNAWEWVIHKYVLHGQGKNRENFWSFHWHDHHKHARKEAMNDHQYQRSVFGWHGQGKEALGLLAATLVTLPLARRYPWFVAGSVFSQWNYYRVHKRSHRDAAWAREHLPWHYDHHMGPNQHANWCVTWPWFDHVMGTREPYVGTAREAADVAKAAAKAARARSAGEGAGPVAAGVDRE